MRVNTLKTSIQVDISNNRALGIQSYGAENDYPQRVMELVRASVTGNSCCDTYKKFIIGRGFDDEGFCRAVINSKGETVEQLHSAVSSDYALFGGFAIHVNYNANYEITSACHVPFEWVRFEQLDDSYSFDNVAIHPDWGKRYTSLRKFKSEDITIIHLYNPNADIIQKQVDEAGGWLGYKGQVYYYSNQGNKTYPLPVFCAALTDMSNEEGLSNITYRNVRCNFLPAGMVIDRNNLANSEEQERETKQELKEFQGDMNAGKLLYINLINGEEPPEFKPFALANTDRDFERAESKTPDIIGAAFAQPPILRAKDIGAGFGADLMKNAYDFYNAQTETERQVVQMVFREIFNRWHTNLNPEGNYNIVPKYYAVNKSLADRLGANVLNVTSLLLDGSKEESTKRSILSVIYGLDDDEITKLLEWVRC